jgi:hypothetical protein
MSEDGFLDGLTRYDTLKRLGAGGMGVVYQVFDRERGCVVALKTMQRYDAASLYRFKREFRTLADARHPNLVGLYELASHEGRWYFTMEYVDGCSFLDFVRGTHVSPPPDSAAADTLTSNRGHRGDAPARVAGGSSRIEAPPARRERLRPALAQLVQAVQALHEGGHLHRDIKPSNVLVTNDGRVVLLDFGLITTVEGSGGHQTWSGLIGTPAYMSPEQTVGGQLSPASDWYSVGAIAFEALTGCFPFQPEPGATVDLVTLIERKRSEDAPAPSTLRGDVPFDLDELCVDLLRRDPASRPRGPEVIRRLYASVPDLRAETGVADVARTIFIGREQPLAILWDAFEAARAGTLAVVHVHGSSGIGKSALVRHFIDGQAIASQARLFEGRCYEQESLPYKALDSVVDAVSQHLATLDDRQLASVLPPSIAELARMFPVLERIDAIANAVSLAARPVDPQSRRRRAFIALRELLTTLASERPLVIYIDDLQWGDVDSAVAIDELLRPPNPPALLFVGCFRSEDAETSLFLAHHVRSMRQMSASMRYRPVALGPLSSAESARLAQTVLGDRGDRQTSAVILEAHGHPYLLRELAQYHASRREEPGAPGGAVTLSGVLEHRIALLPEDCRQVLQVVAVAGHPIDQRVVMEASAVGAAAPVAVSRLRAEKLIRSRSIGERRLIEPYHDQIRETAARGLDLPRSRALHARLAEALERTSADPEQLALHFEAANILDKAATYAERAGDASMELLAFDWAAELYVRSLRLVGGDQSRRQRLTVKAAEAFTNAGRGADAAAQFLAAAAGTDSTPDRLEFQRRAAEQLLGSGRIDDGVVVLRDVLAAVGIAYPRTARSALVGLLARRALIRLRGVGHRARRDEDLAPSTRARLDICRTAAEGLAMVDNIRGAHFQARNLLMTLASGDLPRTSLALALESGFVATAGGPARKRARHLADCAMAIAEQTGHPYALGRAIIANGLGHYLVGEWRAAVTECGRAVGILRDRCVGVRWALSTAQRFEIGGLHYQGELREIVERVPVLLEDARRRGDLYLATELYTRDSHLTWLAADDPATVVRNIDDAMNRWSKSQFHLQHYNAMLAYVHGHLYKRDTAAAWRSFAAAWEPLLKSMLMRVQVLRAEVRFLRARTMLHCAIASGDWRALPEIRKEALRLRRERMRWCDALALMVESAIAAAERDAGRVAASLRLASRACAATDMRLYEACANHVLGAVLGGDEGRAAARASAEWMTAQRVQRPDALVGVFLPMLPDAKRAAR